MHYVALYIAQEGIYVLQIIPLILLKENNLGAYCLATLPCQIERISSLGALCIESFSG